jgi:hypothetical protein
MSKKKKKIPPELDQSRVSPEGREVGNMLADLAEHSIKSAIGLVDKRCSTCAFRRGTVPNGCITAMSDAMKCLIQKHDFKCHHNKSKQCAGFAAAMLQRKNIPAAIVPWDFSETD